MTIARTDSQNALAELVGCTGCLARSAEIPLVGREMYRPAVEKDTPDDPRCEVTRTVSFAWFAMRSLCAERGPSRPCGATWPGHVNCEGPQAGIATRVSDSPARMANVPDARFARYGNAA